MYCHHVTCTVFYLYRLNASCAAFVLPLHVLHCLYLYCCVLSQTHPTTAQQSSISQAAVSSTCAWTYQLKPNGSCGLNRASNVTQSNYSTIQRPVLLISPRRWRRCRPTSRACAPTSPRACTLTRSGATSCCAAWWSGPGRRAGAREKRRGNDDKITILWKFCT